MQLDDCVHLRNDRMLLEFQHVLRGQEQAIHVGVSKEGPRWGQSGKLMRAFKCW
jgi:hypothetical protein